MRWRAALIRLVLIYSAVDAQTTHASETASQPTPAAPSRRDLARHWFSTALSLARAGRYAAAKNLFLEAYTAEPHYLVLYNIARADIQLGELASAANFLRRFLAEGGSNITADQRHAIEHEIEDIEARTPKSSEPQATSALPAVVDAGPRTPPTPAANPIPITPVTSRTAAPNARLAPSEHVGEAPAADATDHAPSQLPGYLLTTGGFAVVSAGIGLLVWNHERFHRWEGENRVLMGYAEGGAGDAARPDESALRSRVVRNNELLNSIQSFDPMPIITVSVGVAAIAAGIWSLSASEGSVRLQVSGGPSELGLHGKWTW
jgi:hypothetical protein